MLSAIVRLAAFLLTVALTACASAPPPLSEAASRVRFITADQAKSCKFVKVVQYTDQISGAGRSATLMRAIGEAGLRNEAGKTGANALVVTKSDSSWISGSVGYTGEVYNCPE